jgi:hypothetical protein
MSEDRWTYPSRDDDSRDIDREMADADAVAAKQATRAVTHAQERERTQGTSADSPGIDPADRERASDGGTPTSD